MLDQILDFLPLNLITTLDLMEADQKIDELVFKIITGVGDVLRNFEPDLVLVHVGIPLPHWVQLYLVTITK